MTPQQYRNLDRLANFIDDLPHDKFHMPSWCSPDATKESCGTAGCVAGWAITVFHKEGFIGCKSLFDGGSYWSPQFENSYGDGAFAEFFGLNMRDAYLLVAGFSCLSLLSHGSADRCEKCYFCLYGVKKARDITPRMAADRIRRILTNYKSAKPEVFSSSSLGGIPERRVPLVQTASL